MNKKDLLINIYITLLIILAIIFYLGLYQGIYSYFKGITEGYNYDLKIYGWQAFKNSIYWYSMLLLPLTFISLTSSIILISLDVISTSKKIKSTIQPEKKNILYYILLFIMIMPLIIYMIFPNIVMLTYKAHIIIGTMLLLYGRIEYRTNTKIIKISKYLIIELIIISIVIVYLFMI